MTCLLIWDEYKKNDIVPIHEFPCGQVRRGLSLCGIVVEKLKDPVKSLSVFCPRTVKSMSGSINL